MTIKGISGSTKELYKKHKALPLKYYCGNCGKEIKGRVKKFCSTKCWNKFASKKYTVISLIERNEGLI